MVQSKPHRKAKHSADIAQMLEKKIRSGAYEQDSKLPTVRDLAEELKVNKNTVVRAYQSLKRKGYLELVRGSGAFVRGREPIPGNSSSYWQEQFDRLIEEAKRREINRENMLTMLEQSVDRVYSRGKVRIAFVECNAEDIQAMSAQLSAGTGHSLEGLMLSDFSTRSAEMARRFDLIVTTFYHLSQVTDALDSDKEKIVGVNSVPNLEALLGIARLHMPVIGLVCAMASVVETLTHIIQSYHPTATVLPALIDDPARLATLFEKADAIVVTRGYQQQLIALKPQVPVIPVDFLIEKQSIDFLLTRIRDLSRAITPKFSPSPLR